MADSQKLVLGFTGLEFTTGMDVATSGKLAFRVKDHPMNADVHAVLLGALIKRQLVITLEDGKLEVSVRESNKE